MEKKKIFYGWWVVAGCSLIMATMFPPVVALANKFLIDITKEMGVSRSAFTLTNTILQSIGIFFSPMIAKNLAKNDMRKIQSISVIGFVVAYASYSLATSVYHLYISAVFVGIFWLNSTLIPVTMMLTNWFSQKRGLAISIAMTGIGLGGFVFSPLVTYFMANYGWRMAYRFMALIILVIALPIAALVLRKKPEDMGLKPYGYEEAGSTNTIKKALPSVTFSVKEARTKGFFILLLIGVFANGIINTGALGQFPPAIQELHGPAVQATIISLYSIIGCAGKLIVGWLNDRFGVIASTLFAGITFGLSFVFMLNGENIVMVYAMAVCMGLGMAIGSVSPSVVTSAIFGQAKYGEAFGAVNSIQQIGLSAGSLFVAFVFDKTGSYKSAWVILLVLTAVTVVSWISAFLASRKHCGIESTKPI